MTKKPLQLKFTEVKAEGNLINVTGNPRKTKQEGGKSFKTMVGVALSEEMKEFLASECIKFQVKPAEYIRRLLDSHRKLINELNSIEKGIKKIIEEVKLD